MNNKVNLDSSTRYIDESNGYLSASALDNLKTLIDIVKEVLGLSDRFSQKKDPPAHEKFTKLLSPKGEEKVKDALYNMAFFSDEQKAADLFKIKRITPKHREFFRTQVANHLANLKEALKSEIPRVKTLHNSELSAYSALIKQVNDMLYRLRNDPKYTIPDLYSLKSQEYGQLIQSEQRIGSFKVEDLLELNLSQITVVQAAHELMRGTHISDVARIMAENNPYFSDLLTEGSGIESSEVANDILENAESLQSSHILDIEAAI